MLVRAQGKWQTSLTVAAEKFNIQKIKGTYE